MFLRSYSDASAPSKPEWWQQHLRRTVLQVQQAVMFSDKSCFFLARAAGRERVWRKPGERTLDYCIWQYQWKGRHIKIWAGILCDCHNWLVHINKNLSECLKNILQVVQPVAIPFLQNHPAFGVTVSAKQRPSPQSTSNNITPAATQRPYSMFCQDLWTHLSQPISNRTLVGSAGAESIYLQDVLPPWPVDTWWVTCSQSEMPSPSSAPNASSAVCITVPCLFGWIQWPYRLLMWTIGPQW